MMGAHEDIPFTGWGADRPADYAPPEGHTRPAVRPAEGSSVQVTSPHLDELPGGCPCVSCHGTRWLLPPNTLSAFELESIRMSLAASRPDAITVITSEVMPVVNP